jgi:SnoaL-like domain
MNTDPYTLTLADVLSIDDTIARYNRGMDGPDKAAFLSAFAVDGVWVSPNAGEFHGHQALGDWFDDKYPRDVTHRRRQHRVTNRRFIATATDRVELWSNFMVLAVTESGPQIIDMGSYSDVLIRHASGAWLIERRVIDRGGAAI